MSNLLQETREKYKKIKEYCASINYVYQLNEFWGGDNMGSMTSIISNSSSPEEVINLVDQTYMYAINFPPEDISKSHIREMAIDWLLKKQRHIGFDVLKEDIEESPFIHSNNKVYREERCLSDNFLRTTSIINQLMKHFNLLNIKKVFELGGGCGHQARTFHFYNPNAKYFIVDLPETLCFSYIFINLNFPNAKTIFVTDKAEIEKLDDYDFVFLPTVFSEDVLPYKFDLFINTASLGEMTNDVIHYWMDYIQNKANIPYLFTLNRYLNTVTDNQFEWRKNENECSVSYDDKWQILNWEVEPIYTRCPYIDTLHCRYVEIIAKRPWNISDEEKLKISSELSQEVRDEDWFRISNKWDIMNARDNVLVNDMTMTGPLFKLWESIRLNSNVENISTMISLLNRLIREPDKKYFEEKPFYVDKLAKTISI